MPQPKVTSSVIRLTRRKYPPVPVKAPEDADLMFKLVRAAFNQRRKTLVNAVSSQVQGVTKEQIEEALADLGFDTRIRGEVLSTADFLHIAESLNTRGNRV